MQQTIASPAVPDLCTFALDSNAKHFFQNTRHQCNLDVKKLFIARHDIAYDGLFVAYLRNVFGESDIPTPTILSSFFQLPYLRFKSVLWYSALQASVKNALHRYFLLRKAATLTHRDDAPSSEYYTLFAIAASVGAHETVGMLLSDGFDPHSKLAEGYSAFEYCTEACVRNCGLKMFGCPHEKCRLMMISRGLPCDTNAFDIS